MVSTQAPPEQELVLVVDDSAITRALVRSQLECERYEVLEARTGTEALEILERTSVSLITLDLEMPELDGYELCRMIRKLEEKKGSEEKGSTEVPIIFLTESDELTGRIKGYEAGACDFITKRDMSTGELLHSINTILRPNLALAGTHVLIVEDTKLVRLMLDKCIRSLGVRTTHALDGQHGYDLLKSDPTQYDLIILDNKMPNMDGIELCRRIRGELGLKTIPVFFLTGHEERDIQFEFFKAGATDYLIKPFLREELVARVRVHIETAKRARQLARLNTELERSNTVLNKFATIAAHDLKSPLLSMRLSAELLEEQLNKKCDEDSLNWLAKITRGIDRMDQMVQGLLNYARLGGTRLSKENVPLTQIAKDVAEDLDQLIEDKQAQIEIQSLPVVIADKSLMRQLLQNLISNALKYQQPEVPPIITIWSTPYSNSKDRGFAVHVKDNGRGFDNEQAEEIFNLFKRLVGRSDVEGHGIGLATCKRIVEEHGATISATSTKGEGATFTVYFPSDIVESGPDDSPSKNSVA